MGTTSILGSLSGPAGHAAALWQEAPKPVRGEAHTRLCATAWITHLMRSTQEHRCGIPDRSDWKLELGDLAQKRWHGERRAVENLIRTGTCIGDDGLEVRTNPISGRGWLIRAARDHSAES